MRRVNQFLILLGFVSTAIGLRAQEVAPGSWLTRYNPGSAQTLVQVEGNIVFASYYGLYHYNTVSGMLREYSKADGLSENGVSSLFYSSQVGLIIGYRSGLVDIARLDDAAQLVDVTNWTLIRDAAGIVGDRAIHRMRQSGKYLFLCTGFGILVWDPVTREVYETYRYIGAKGSQVAVSDVAFVGDSIYAATKEGVLAASMAESVNRQYFGSWSWVKGSEGVQSVVAFDGKLTAGLPEKGISVLESEGWQVLDSVRRSSYRFFPAGNMLWVGVENQLLERSPTAGTALYPSAHLTRINDLIAKGPAAVFLADQQNGLIRMEPKGTFEVLVGGTLDSVFNEQASKSVRDQNGLIWSIGTFGISVTDPVSGRVRSLSVASGNGGLPSSAINALAIDPEGLVWFASERGIGYFYPEGILANVAVNAVLPVLNQRYALSSESCRAIQAEAGGRIWVGAASGLFLLSSDGGSQIAHYSRKNSPLPSDVILGLQYNRETGILLVNTVSGLLAYRTTSVQPEDKLNKITIFPNPVRPGFRGLVAVKGLTAGAVVKFTDVSGRLVYETKSEGGLASWNLTDYTGVRARGGIYLVMVRDARNRESLLGKLAIIE